LCARWQQNIGYASEAPISKPQIPNNIQIPISNDRNGSDSEFGHLVIGNYLEFGICLPVGRDIEFPIPILVPAMPGEDFVN
jgi:hypothetical protein